MPTKQRYRRLLHGLMLVWIAGCVDPYRPPQLTAPNRYLVVDGYLNGGTGTSVIRLSRTQNVDDSQKPQPEGRAVIRVESETGTAYPFTESETGTYTLASAVLPFGSRYRVSIQTSDGSQYQSDPILIKQTPPIDSITWSVENNGLQVFVNTHDPANQTRYYRWSYEDT